MTLHPCRGQVRCQQRGPEPHSRPSPSRPNLPAFKARLSLSAHVTRCPTPTTVVLKSIAQNGPLSAQRDRATRCCCKLRHAMPPARHGYDTYAAAFCHAIVATASRRCHGRDGRAEHASQQTRSHCIQFLHFYPYSRPKRVTRPQVL